MSRFQHKMAEIFNLNRIFFTGDQGVKKPQDVLNCSLGNLSKMKNVFFLYQRLRSLDPIRIRFPELVLIAPWEKNETAIHIFSTG